MMKSGTFTLCADNGLVTHFDHYDIDVMMAEAERSGAETCTVETDARVLVVLTKGENGIDRVWQVYRTAEECP